MNRTGTVYGQSLYALAKEEALEARILQELEVLKAVFTEQPDYGKLLSSRSLSKQERTGLLDDALRGKVHPYVLNFLKLLTEKGCVAGFADCCRAYREQYNLEHGILQVRAISAIALTDSQKQRLTEKLTAITGQKIDLVCKEDPSVLGGVQLRYNGVQVDGTVQGRLEAVAKSLKNTVL